MSRPQSKKSSLIGSSPIAPPPAKETDRAPETAEAQQAEPRKRATPAAKKTATAKPKPTKTSFYAEPDDIDRMRGAYRATIGTENWSSFSHFLSSAVLAEVERLEAKHNRGKTFQSVEAGGIPRGRPMGE